MYTTSYWYGTDIGTALFSEESLNKAFNAAWGFGVERCEPNEMHAVCHSNVQLKSN